MKTPNKRYDWIVTRYTKELFWVQNNNNQPLTKRQAIDKARDPYDVSIVRETARKRKIRP